MCRSDNKKTLGRYYFKVLKPSLAAQCADWPKRKVYVNHEGRLHPLKLGGRYAQMWHALWPALDAQRKVLSQVALTNAWYYEWLELLSGNHQQNVQLACMDRQ